MRITGYEVDEGKLSAVYITDETRGIEQKKYVEDKPRGEWIRDNEFLKFTGDFKCSNCNIISGLPFPYCPNCGTNMNKKIKNTQDEYAKMRAREF